MRERLQILNKRIIVFFLLLIIVGLSMVSILLSTRSGVGVHPDTVTYVEAAQNLLNGVGLRVLSDDGEFTVLTHFPPL
jgi:hypothetical protein